MILIEPSIQAKFGRALRRRALAAFLAEAAHAARLQGDVSVLLTGNARIRRLNREFRHKDQPTDVLSFPAALPGEVLAGDLAISVEAAAHQAREAGHSLAVELQILILHGLLHLAGYDHETDSGQMARRETTLRRRFGLTHGLIERATKPQLPAKKQARRSRTP